MKTQLQPRITPEELELQKKREELARLKDQLADREADLATLTAELRSFEQLYLSVVGRRLAQLDELNAQIAELLNRRSPTDEGAAEQAQRARAQARESAEEFARAKPDTASFQPTEDLRRLYRDLAKLVHPDLASTDSDRAQRTSVMAQVNAAYEAGDAHRLEAILREWEFRPESVTGDTTGAEIVRVIRQIAQVSNRLAVIDGELAPLRESDLHTLKLRVDSARAEGTDLLADMASELDNQIERTRHELRVTRDAPGGAA